MFNLSIFHRLRDWQLFLLVHSLFALLALSPFLLGIGLFSGIGLGHSYPFFELSSIRHLLSGEIILNPFNLNGFPSFVPIGFSTNPLTYLFNALLPPFTDLHWFTFANMVAGGVLTSMLLRRFAHSRAASIVGGACYMIGSWWLVVTPEFSPSMPILPLMAFVLMQSRTHPVRASVWGSLLCGYIWLGVPIQVSLMLFTALGAGTAAFSFQQRSRGKRAVLQPLIAMTIAVGIGTLMGLIKIIPSYVFGNLSWRAGGLPLTEATASGIQPLTIFTYLFPYASFPFLNFGGELLQIYIGVFGFFFLIIGLWMVCSRSASPALRWWVAAYVFIFALSFAHSPLATFLHSFPPFSYFRGAGRWTMIGSFAVAPIVAEGFDALVQGKVENMRKMLARFLKVCAIALCAACAIGQLLLIAFSQQIIAFFQHYFAWFHAQLKLGPPLSYYQTFVEQRIHELAAYPLILQPRAFFPVLELLVLAVLLTPHVWNRLRNKAAILACFSLLTASLTLIWYDKSLPRSTLSLPNPAIEFLQKHPGTAMGIFSNGTEFELLPGHRFSKADQVEWALAHLVPNTNLFSGIHSLDYFDNIAARRPSALATWVGAQWAPGPDKYRLVAMPGTTQEKIEELARRKDLLAIQGVRYLVSSFPLPEPLFQKVLSTDVTSQHLPLFIYENPAARPRVYFATNIVTMEEQEEKALEYLFNDTWPKRTSLLECEPSCDPILPDGEGTIELLNEAAQTLTFQTATDQPQWLIVTISRIPGWQVFIDDRPAESVFANGAYFGIRIPEGTHTVTLCFSIRQLLKGGLAEMLHL